MRAVALLAAAIALVGCGPVLVGAGDRDKLDASFEVCKWETLGYAFIPDLGVSETLAKNHCMRSFGWEPAPEKLMGWRWVGRP